jgi:hypothetical protein
MLSSIVGIQRQPEPAEALEVPTFRRMLPQLAVELRRARRFERPLAVVVLSPELDTLPGRSTTWIKVSARPANWNLTQYLLLGSFLRNATREIDVVTAVPESLLYASLLPETTKEGAVGAIARLRQGFLQCGGVGLRSGVAEFPLDGFTIEDLYNSALLQWQTAEPTQSLGEIRQDDRVHG